MAIERMKDKPHGKPRKLPWRYRDRANGITRYFKTRKEAEEYQEEQNSRKRRTGLGLPGTIDDLRKYTVRDIIRSYMANQEAITEDDEIYEDVEELSSESSLPENVFLTLYKFSRRDICDLDLFQFNQQVAEQYRDDRLKETWKPHNSIGEPKPVSPRTVRWEISHFQRAWKAAKKWQGLSHLENPWEKLTVPGSTGGRGKRGLKPGELEKLIEHCKGCLGPNRYYVPLAIHLAIETGMRRQELIGLEWRDIDPENRKITIGKSKTDWKTEKTGRVIVLTFFAKCMLTELGISLRQHGRLPGPDGLLVCKPGADVPNGRIFRDKNGDPLTEEAFTQAFRDVKRRAKLPHVTFRSTLRTTANMMFYKARLDDDERDIMMGHEDSQRTGSRFYRDDEEFLPGIQDKLDKYILGGRTEEEVIAKFGEVRRNLVKEGETRGLTTDDATKSADAAMQAHFRFKVEETISTSPPS
jgi:integrase